MANSRDFQRILMVFSWGIHENFHGISPWKKHEKNITKAIKNPLIFQFS